MQVYTFFTKPDGNLNLIMVKTTFPMFLFAWFDYYFHAFCSFVSLQDDPKPHPKSCSRPHTVLITPAQPECCVSDI